MRRILNCIELIQPHVAQKPVLRGEVGCACVALYFFIKKVLILYFLYIRHLNCNFYIEGIYFRCVELRNYFGTCGVGSKLFTTPPPPYPPRARLVTTTAAAAATIVLVVACVIFMRPNPGAAKDGSVKVFILARVTVERPKPKRHAAARRPGREPDPAPTPALKCPGGCSATAQVVQSRTRSKPNTSTYARRHHLSSKQDFRGGPGAGRPV